MHPDHDRLTSLPLFADLSSAEIGRVLGAFRERTLEDGTVLFEAGARPTAVWLLVEGSLSIRHVGGELLVVTPPQQVGELSAVTGEDRNLTAVAVGRCRVLECPVTEFEAFLRANGPIGFVLQRNLLRVAARKIARDRRRLIEMRDNIISTQRAMKSMREALLESEDTPLHAALFEQLDALVEQNRKIHYLVEPSRMVPTHVRLNDGLHRVTALSKEWLYLADPPSGTEREAALTGVLILDGAEIPISGRVVRVAPGEAGVLLDSLIPEYEDTLARHLSRAQVLDLVL